MTRRYGRAKGAERVSDHAPDTRFERRSGWTAARRRWCSRGPWTLGTRISAPPTALQFAAYAREVLAPTLRVGDIVVMDNLSVHKVKGTLDPIHGRGAVVLFLPPHGPDWNPIGLCRSEMKAALDEITASDISGWFRHCGYC